MGDTFITVVLGCASVLLITGTIYIVVHLGMRLVENFKWRHIK